MCLEREEVKLIIWQKFIISFQDILNVAPSVTGTALSWKDLPSLEVK